VLDAWRPLWLLWLLWSLWSLVAVLVAQGAFALRGVLREAVQAFHAVLDGYTLADLVHNRSSLARVLFIQPAAGGD